ncbi:MAG TPA: T9SS type A sorting domain-containing protein [Chitinophagaceae bacterium]|jgi:hypothetical protein|nr:T9SS type A sorting domain-containing protein [Chitinophagaceae bacterium]HMU60107.1 T9SS type A sorting domain-containing protein [Chitinophagaceae bacterium]
MKKFTFLTVSIILASFMFANTAYSQITQRGTSTTDNTITTNQLSMTKPVGLSVGDVMLVNIVQGDDADGQTLSNAGRYNWTVVAGGKLGANGTSSWWGTVLYKIADATDVAAASFAFNLDTDADGAVGGLFAFYNVNTNGGVGPNGTGTGPFDVATGTLQVTGDANNQTITAPSITTNTNNAAVIMFAMGGDNNSITGWSSSLTQILYANSNTNPDELVGAAWKLLGTAGSTGNMAATMDASDRNGGVLVALKPLTVDAGHDQLVAGTSVTLSGSTNAGGTPTYAWTKTSGTGGTITSTGSASTTVTGFTDGTYVFRLTVNGNVYDEVTVRVISGTNLWASTTAGTQISSYTVSGGTLTSGPTNIFAPTFPGSVNTYTRTAALGRANLPSNTAGSFYWLGTSNSGSTNGGVVEVFGASAAGNKAVKIGSVDMNGASTTDLGFVRLGMGPDGTGWILAGDGSSLILAKFASNNLEAANVTIEDASVSLTGGSAATFVNGDICLDGSGKIYALANDGSSVTQIFVGSVNGTSSTLTKKWDLVDPSNTAFTGQVNGVAFDISGALYITTTDGLYYINPGTINGVAGTVQCSLVEARTGLQDLASNVFPVNTPLPVKMTAFAVTKQGNNAILNWTTASEINASRFEIEKSYDGVNFTSVGEKQAIGNSASDINYIYSDPIGISSGIIYYRLKTIDNDGQFSLSKVVALRINGNTVSKLTVYPNPFTTDLKVELNAEKDAKGTLRVSNAAGQVIVNRNSQLLKGNNVIILSSELSALNRGMYIVELITEEGRLTQKIIKR